MLSTKGLLWFENNPSFLRKIPASGGDQKADRCPGIHPGSGEIPVCKLDDLCRLVYKIRFYVNSWGRAKIEQFSDRVGAKAPARFLCITEEDSLSKITEVTHTEAIVPLVQFQTGVVIIVEGT